MKGREVSVAGRVCTRGCPMMGSDAGMRVFDCTGRLRPERCEGVGMGVK